jgi:hypothetical protein
MCVTVASINDARHAYTPVGTQHARRILRSRSVRPEIHCIRDAWLNATVYVRKPGGQKEKNRKICRNPIFGNGGYWAW